MSQIPIQKIVFDKDSYGKIINTQFSQLIGGTQEQVSTFTIDDFFELYDQIFYQIPKEGDINSHRYILQKEADYLGVVVSEEDIQALLDEITSLRQQVLDAETTINELGKTVNING